MTEFNTFDQGKQDYSEADAIAAKLADMRAQMANLEKIVNEHKNVEHEAELNVERARQMLREAEERQSQIKSEIWDTRRNLRELANNITANEKALNQALSNQEQRAEYDALAKRFDDIIKGLAWREWALDHQMSGAKHMAIAGRCINADKMGLGKSLQGLMAADMLEAKRILVIAPKDVASNYLKEIKRWAPHRTAIALLGNNPTERDFAFRLLSMAAEFILVTNYEIWRRDKSVIKSLIDLRLDTVILDEAHTIKNLKTAAFRGVRDIVYAPNVCPKCGSTPIWDQDRYGRYTIICPGYDVNTASQCSTIMRPGSSVPDVDKYCSIKNVFPLTGTPILNRPQDLFPLLYLVDRQTFSREEDYLLAYCERDYSGNKWRFQWGGLERLAKRIASRYISRDRLAAGVKIPPQGIQVHTITMDKELYANQYEFLTLLKERALIKINSTQAMPVAAMIALITRQRQAALWPDGIVLDEGKLPISLNESIKMDAVICPPRSMANDSDDWTGLLYDLTDPDLGRDVATGRFIGERVAVMSQFKTALAELERRCKAAGISVVRYDGDTPESLRQEIQKDFDAYTYTSDPLYRMRWQVVLANYKTGGQGLNLNACSQMIELDSEWNAGKTDQARARIDRMGQTKETTVHRILLDKSIELWMDQLVSDKRDMIDGFESEMDIAGKLLDAIRSGEVEM